MVRLVLRVFALGCVLLLSVAGAASGDTTVLNGNVGHTSLPTWANAYDWPAGDGYVGVSTQTQTSDPFAYGFATGRPSGAGAWIWPTGNRVYPPGWGQWSYVAPGTTRVLSVKATLAYTSRLLSQHCIKVVAYVGAEQRDGKLFCKPPGAPAGEGTVEINIADPANSPTAKQLVLRIEHLCDFVNTSACDRYIPADTPENNGVRFKTVQMVLVDDDLPVLHPAGPFWDLRDTYVDGTETYPLTVAATDAGAGLTRTAFEEPAVGEYYHHEPMCDPTHHTAALGARICPPESSTQTTVDTRPMPEGKHLFRETANDLAGNIGATAPWTVYVDRTAPDTPTATGEISDDGTYINGQGDKQITIAADDPVLADGNLGSGVRHVALEEVGQGTLAQTDLDCTNRCAAHGEATLTVDTSAWTEGSHELRAIVTDLVGHSTASDSWTIYVDRTGPAMVGSVDAVFDEDAAIADLTWDPMTDPLLPTGDAGAGFTRYEVRTRPSGGAWLGPETLSPTIFPTVELGQRQLGDGIDYEIKAYDAVGNVSVFASTASVALTDVTAGDEGDFAPGEEAQPNGAPDPGESAEWRNVDPNEETDTPAPEDASATTSSTAEQMSVAAPFEVEPLAGASSSYDTRMCARDGDDSPCGTYSGRQAAAYARAYWQTDHGAYRNFDYTYYDSDCTNFASQVLHFGGLHFMRTYPGINDPRHDDNDLYVKGPGSWWSQKYTNFFGHTRYRNSTSWSVGWVLYNQLMDNGLARIVSPHERLRSGDILFYWWNGRTQIEDIDHVNVVAGVRRRRVYIAQHAPDRFETIREWNERARGYHPNFDRVVLRPTATRFDLP